MSEQETNDDDEQPEENLPPRSSGGFGNFVGPDMSGIAKQISAAFGPANESFSAMLKSLSHDVINANKLAESMMPKWADLQIRSTLLGQQFEEITKPFRDLQTARLSELQASVSALLDRSMVDSTLIAQTSRIGEMFREQMKPWLDWTRHLGGLTEFWKITPEQLERWRRLGYPDNWDDELDIDTATGLAVAGWPLAWVPSPEIVRALVSAVDDDARDLILLERKDQILDDCDKALAEINCPDLADHVEMARQTVASLRIGYPMPAQAASAVIGDSLCRRVWKLNSAGVRRHAGIDVLELPIAKFIWGLCMVAVAAAFSQFREEDGDAIPSRYNRHATIHAISLEQYTDANSICGVLSAVSLICQANSEFSLEAEEAA